MLWRSSLMKCRPACRQRSHAYKLAWHPCWPELKHRQCQAGNRTQSFLHLSRNSWIYSPFYTVSIYKLTSFALTHTQILSMCICTGFNSLFASNTNLKWWLSDMKAQWGTLQSDTYAIWYMVLHLKGHMPCLCQNMHFCFSDHKSKIFWKTDNNKVCILQNLFFYSTNWRRKTEKSVWNTILEVKIKTEWKKLHEKWRQS